LYKKYLQIKKSEGFLKMNNITRIVTLQDRVSSEEKLLRKAQLEKGARQRRRNDINLKSDIFQSVAYFSLILTTQC
jgi:hypothetical protein